MRYRVKQNNAAIGSKHGDVVGSVRRESATAHMDDVARSVINFVGLNCRAGGVRGKDKRSAGDNRCDQSNSR